MGAARAAEVRGSLALGKYHPKPETSTVPAYRWELENGLKEVLPDRVPARELAVVLTGDGPSQSGGELAVQISGGELLPSTLAVRAGTTLKIDNADDIAHELEAVGLDGFSAEATGPHGQRGVRLEQAGSWPIIDRLTPHARAYLHVLPDLIAIATLNDDGTFSFGELPEGKYTLHVFHGASEVLKKPVEVSGKLTTLDALPLTPSAN